MASLLYGAGLRLMECLRLRVKDVDFGYGQILVRDGKGAKDRVSMLPQAVIEPLTAHLERVRALHNRDLAAGYGEVWLPHALDRKYPCAAREWGWQYIFPSRKLSTDPRSGAIRRHHLDEDVLQRAVKEAGASGGRAQAGELPCVSSCVLPRNLLESGLRHPHPCRNCSDTRASKTTMVYTHVMKQRWARREKSARPREQRVANTAPADLLEVPRSGDRLDRRVELELEQRVHLDFAAQRKEKSIEMGSVAAFA